MVSRCSLRRSEAVRDQARPRGPFQSRGRGRDDEGSITRRMETEMSARLSQFVRPYVLCGLVLAGCASAAVTQQTQQQPTDFDRPSQIVVYPFAANGSDVTLNQSIVQKAYRAATSNNGDADQLQIAHDTAQAICQQIVSDLTAKSYNA